MKFLIKCAFWLAVIIMIMPTDQTRQDKLYAKAEQAVGQAATFCDRHPALCDRGAVLWATFKDKAAFAAGLATDLAMEVIFSKRRANERDADAKAQRVEAPARSNTLRTYDREAAWRAPTESPIDGLLQR